VDMDQLTMYYRPCCDPVGRQEMEGAETDAGCKKNIFKNSLGT
jgi:hypothetical protein